MSVDHFSTFVFPFHSVTDSEFLLSLSYDIDSAVYDLNKVLINNDTSNSFHDKTDMSLSDNIYTSNKTLYVTIEELNQLNVATDSLSLLQLNSRSLKKNLNSIKNLLFHFPVKPSIISIAETWIKPS